MLAVFSSIIMDEGLPVDIFYFDFRKAFDTVPHHRLLVKLENIGITGETLEIIEDFLSDREMRVGVGDSFSEVLKIVSGVPQGSVLGPILFLLFVNYLPDNIKNRILLFADDLKLIANAMNKEVIDEDLRSLEGGRVYGSLDLIWISARFCTFLPMIILEISIIWMALSYFPLSLKKIWNLLWMKSLTLVNTLKRL